MLLSRFPIVDVMYEVANCCNHAIACLTRPSLSYLVTLSVYVACSQRYSVNGKPHKLHHADYLVSCPHQGSPSAATTSSRQQHNVSRGVWCLCRAAKELVWLALTLDMAF